MDAPRALVFRPLVKGNEALGTRLEHEQISWEKLRVRYRMSVIYRHLVIAATRALRFADHVTKGNGGFEDENGIVLSK